MANDADTTAKLSDDELSAVAGGNTREYRAAWDVINGRYGAGQDCIRRLEQAGLNSGQVIYLANGLSQGYASVAQDIIMDVYGTGQDRVKRLRAAGYDPALAQAIVNGMLINS